MSKFMWCGAFQTYKTFAVAAVSLACDKVKEEMEQLQILTGNGTVADGKVFEDVQQALYHIINDAAPLAIPTLAKACNGVQCLPVELQSEFWVQFCPSLNWVIELCRECTSCALLSKCCTLNFMA